MGKKKTKKKKVEKVTWRIDGDGCLWLICLGRCSMGRVDNEGKADAKVKTTLLRGKNLEEKVVWDCGVRRQSQKAREGHETSRTS